MNNATIDTIKFGTDGWRAIIAKDYTVANVARVSAATAGWLIKQKPAGTIVVGYDCRFGGKLFAETTAKVLCQQGIKVILSEGFCSTPMISLAAVKLNCDLGIIITASHNPASYNGFKIKGAYGGPLLPNDIAEIENLVPDYYNWQSLENLSLEDFKSKNLLSYHNLEDLYVKHVEENFDLELIRNSGLNLAYDAMYGAGQNVMRRLFPNATFLHCDYNPSFDGQAPEPIDKNLQELAQLIKIAGDIDSGLATDGDADRIGLYDHEGTFVDSHHIILLLINYLHNYKKFSGKVCITFSVSPRIKKLCEHYGLDCEVLKIGFKYVCDRMLSDDVLLGGEESGGIAIKGHIPERDGIWMGLVIWEYMAQTGKNLKQLIDEAYKITGSFFFDRSDLHISEDLKQRVIETCKNVGFKNFGRFQVQSTETIDGFKYLLSDKEWLMIRPSGTEPVLRVYAEADNEATTKEILKEAEKLIMAI